MTTGRILIIDDEKDLARLFEYALKARGHEVRCAKDGETGLKEFRRWKPDLILLDLVLPGMSGGDFLKAVRATSAVKVILVSGQRGMNARALGADDELAKPFNLDELCARAARALEPAPPARPRRRAEKAG